MEIAQAYQKNGAACLSILTDEKHFQGSFENLETVRNSGVNVSQGTTMQKYACTCGLKLELNFSFVSLDFPCFCT